jgi:hypothetical protein
MENLTALDGEGSGLLAVLLLVPAALGELRLSVYATTEVGSSSLARF